MIGLRLALSVGLALVGFTTPVVGEAETPAKVARIGYLGVALASDDSRTREAFLEGLRGLGYVEGRNLLIEYRDAKGKPERFPALAVELIALKVDVIVTAGGTLAALAAKRATTTVPIVFTAVGDPVADGLVASLARPGGNLTGLSLLLQLVDKLLELLKQTVPEIYTAADADEMACLLGEVFAHRDPPAVAVDLTPAEFEAFVRLFCPKAAAEGLTIVAR